MTVSIPFTLMREVPCPAHEDCCCRPGEEEIELNIIAFVTQTEHEYQTSGETVLNAPWNPSGYCWADLSSMEQMDAQVQFQEAFEAQKITVLRDLREHVRIAIEALERVSARLSVESAPLISHLNSVCEELAKEAA